MHPVLLWIGGALAALGVAWPKGILPAWRLTRRVVHFFDDLAGEAARDGVPERPGVMRRLETIETNQVEHSRLLGVHCERLTAIEHELHPNGGQSLRDVADRIELAVVDTETR